MYLGDVRDGAIYAMDGLTVVRGSVDGGFEPMGGLATAYGVRATGARRILVRRAPKRLLEPVVGRYQSTNLWPLASGTLLATVGTWLFRSGDRGRSWTAVHDLADSSPLKGVLRSALSEFGERIYLAEYSLGSEPARVLVSDDDGRTWSTFLERSDARHFHGLYADPYSGRLWGNTGDRDDESAIGYFEDGGFVPVGSGSQAWRGVELAFTAGAVLWGKDASFADARPIYRLDRSDVGTAASNPERVGATGSVLFHLEAVEFGDTEWVVGATTSQPMVDTTLTPEERRNTCPRDVTVLAASSASDFETWHELASFERRYTVGDVAPGVPTADAHAFLAVDPAVGVLVNPYNTKRHNGDIVRISPRDVQSRADSATVSAGAEGSKLEVLA